MRQGLLNLSVSIQRAKASMAVRMDEAAAAFHPLWLQRSVIAIVAVFVATQILPLWICGLWFLGHVGI